MFNQHLSPHPYILYEQCDKIRRTLGRETMGSLHLTNIRPHSNVGHWSLWVCFLEGKDVPVKPVWVKMSLSRIFFLISLYYLTTVIIGCSIGCSCIDGIGECLADNAPVNPYFGDSIYSIETLHVTAKQKHWLRVSICRGTLIGIETIYLHEDEACRSQYICGQQVLCW